ncbi:transcription elongation factor GreAB, partial [Enterococcus faecium]|nr:transcription elongation factor GreAB [Enterococcus faecium]
NDFDYQLKIESWQVDQVTSKGIYLNVDFGVANHGQLFIGGYKVDQLENGDFNLYVKHDDLFYFMNDQNAGRNRYMNGETLVKQLSLYNGTVPLKKEPVLSELNEIISAINFLAEHDVSDGKQMQRLEIKLENALQASKIKLKELDKKLIELNQLAKDSLLADSSNLNLANDYETIQRELSSVKQSRAILHERFTEIVSEIEEYQEIRAVAEGLKIDPESKENVNRK